MILLRQGSGGQGHAAATEGFRINGWHVLAAVVGFFALVIAVDVTFAVLAYKTFPGEVSVTPYEDGLVYNRHLAQLTEQEKLGWRAAAAARPDGVDLYFADRAGRPLTGLTVSGKLERPATEAGRVVPIFVEREPGHYVAALRRPAGAWDLSLEAQDLRGARFIAERRLTWP